MGNCSFLQSFSFLFSLQCILSHRQQYRVQVYFFIVEWEADTKERGEKNEQQQGEGEREGGSCERKRGKGGKKKTRGGMGGKRRERIITRK